MERFWRLLEESVLFQGLLMTMVFGTVCYLVIAGREVPREMWAMTGIIIGFFFGAKVQIARRASKDR